jgi:hypothetical protein
MASMCDLKDGDHSVKVNDAELLLLRAGLDQLSGSLAKDLTAAPKSISDMAVSLVTGLTSALDSRRDDA